MAWTPVSYKAGDLVGTPEGVGKIRRISESSDTAQVDVNGQLFEIQLGELQQLEPTPAEPKQEARPFVEGEVIERGQPVQKVGNPKSTGKIIDITQRTMSVKWDANGKVAKFPKREVLQGQHIEKPGNTPQQQGDEPDEPDDDKVDAKVDTPEQKTSDLADDLYGLLNLKQKLEDKIDAEVDGELKDLREAVKKTRKLEIQIGDRVNVVEGIKHKQLEQLIAYASLRLSPLLVGMAGTGKTHAGFQTAEALGLPFYSISVGAQTTKTDIMGYMDASGRYIRTHFREAYEHGGVFLMDEIDAGNANVLITINAALSNGLAAFPDAMIKRHPDFVFIASANTFGNGANRQYVGRNQLDAATLDRFAIIEWLIDDDLEESLAVGLNGKAWYMAVRASRDFVSEKGIRALISPRATQKGSRLIDIGQPLEEVIDATLLGSVPDDKKSDVKQVATSIFEKFASEVPKKLSREVDPPTALDLVKDPVIDLDNVPF